VVSAVTVTVPATTANLGPGFDCLGAALTFYNQFTFSPLTTGDSLAITVMGREADRVKTDASNLVYQAFAKFYHHLGQTPPPVQIDIGMEVPLARGLGSSATAIVGGLLGANQVAGAPLSPTAVMELAIAMEGHPDNVVPAQFGGCRLSATGVDRDWEICDLPWHEDVGAIVAIPNFELSTEAARQVLPSHYSRADAIFNTAHLGLLLQGLATAQADWLRAALQDRIHQPYREALIPGYGAVRSAAIEAGAYGLVISGAGPTLLALTHPDQAAAVAAAMAETWSATGMGVDVKELAIDRQGARIS
jgi:homoserine kinase